MLAEADIPGESDGSRVTSDGVKAQTLHRRPTVVVRFTILALVLPLVMGLDCGDNQAPSRLGIVIYSANASGGLQRTFGSPSLGQGPGALAWLTGDVNGDGRTDILQPWKNGDRLGLIVYTSNGTGYTSTFGS